MTAVPNSIRKSAYASLFYGNQMICGWTWQSMHGGEEQYLEGMMDWDGIANLKYDEYEQIAAEFKKIEKYGFPYKEQAEVALAFSFPGQIVSYAFPQQHHDQVQNCFNLFYERNIDTRVVDITQSSLKYKLLMVPGVAVMDTLIAGKIQIYVNNGGTVVISSCSAVVDEGNQVLRTTQPGLLNDVFGISVAGFEEPEQLNEISKEKLKGKQLHVVYQDKNIYTNSSCIDVIEAKGAQVLGNITSLDKNYPVITSIQYGKGRAIYIGLPAKAEVLNPLIDELISELSIKKGPEVPKGIMAMYIDSNHILYLNTGSEAKTIELKGALHSVLFDKNYTGKFTLQPYEPEFIEIK